MFPNPPTTLNKPLDYRLIAALSLLLSLWLILIDPIISRDSIIYLRTADAYLQDGFFASQQLFGRPALSVCMALVHQLTGLSLLHSGLLVSSLFYALLCVGFVATVRTLGGDRRTQIFAAIVILSHPMIGAYRSSIMRDPAFWSLLLLAFRQLLLFSRSSAWQHQLGWFACILLATLFRFEGLFFAALAPLSLLLSGDPHRRLRNCLRLLLPQLAAIAAMAAAILLYQRVLNPGARLFPDIEKYLNGLLAFPQQFAEISANTGAAMLEFTALEDTTVATVAGLAAILVLNICRAICWPWVITLGWGLWRGLLGKVRPADAALLNAHLAISLVYLAVYVLIRQFMLERYTAIFAVLALLYLPFVLNGLWQNSSQRIGRIAVAVLLVLMSADTLHNHDYRKAYVRDAATWLETNTPEHASLLTNDRYIAYFSRREVAWSKGKPTDHKFDAAQLAAEPELWRGVDYLAVEVKRRQQADWARFLEQYSLSELVEFDGGRMGSIYVVKVTGAGVRAD